jgi:hypothetical protein
MTVTAGDLDAIDPDLEHDDLGSIVHRRVTGQFRIDEWGFDRDVLAAMAPLARLRWRFDVEDERLVPEIGPALLVYTRRIGLSEPFVLGSAVWRRCGRPVRSAGSPGRVPLARPARQIGGVPSSAADLRGLLRAGNLVSWPLGREPLRPYHVPTIPKGPIEVALETGAPVLPVALLGAETGRRWIVRFGTPVVTRGRGRSVDPAALAGEARQGLQWLITDLQRRRR